MSKPDPNVTFPQKRKLKPRPGKLEWGGGQRLSEIADTLELSTDDAVEGPLLRVQLVGEDGESAWATIPLAERIRNDGGNLRFSRSSPAESSSS